MPREKECYRSVLERLDEVYPGKAILTITDVANYTGRSRAWASKFINANVAKKRFKESWRNRQRKACKPFGLKINFGG